MDRELAGAVFKRWEDGLPVAEVSLYKAASVFGIDPQAALAEARFYTCLDRYLLEKRAMTKNERQLFSLAAGFEPGVMVKSAAAFGLSPDELIVGALRELNWVPKLANLSAGGGDTTVAGPPNAQAAMQQSQQPEQAMAAPPQPGKMVQQIPQARQKPTPTAPEQIPASPDGNLDMLLQEHQGVFGQQATDNGGMPPAGMPEPPPPPPAPEERIRQVAPDVDEETATRYGQKLQEFEQQIQMPIADPKSMVKFVKELQKVDGKRIDQGIKAFGEQLEQEQAAELGIGQPTVSGGAGKMPGTMGAPQAQPGAPKPQVKPKTTTPQQQPAASQVPAEAVEKVANAGRLLARAHVR